MMNPNLPDSIVRPIGHVLGRTGPPGKRTRDRIVGLVSRMVLSLTAGIVLESLIITGRRVLLGLTGMIGVMSGKQEWPSYELPELRARPEAALIADDRFTRSALA